jgi:magnesium transporter
MPHTPKEQAQKHLLALSNALENNALNPLSEMLNGLPAGEIAHLLESSPPKWRETIWKLIDITYHGEVLSNLSEEVEAQFLQGKKPQELAEITKDLQSDDIADILQQLPERIISQVLSSMDQQNRLRIENIIQYSEDSAGGLMNTDTTCIRPRLTIDVVQRLLRSHGEIPKGTDNLFVINRKNEFIGVLPLSSILTCNPEVSVREMMETDTESIPASMPAHEVALLFQRYNWLSAPVVNKNNQLIGRITIDDVIDVIRDDAEHSLLSMAGLDNNHDTFSPALKTTQDRAVWLGINLLTAFIAATTINIFHNTIDQIVALAILMPIVAGMGGVAGSQTLTIIIRGIALGQIGPQNRSWLIRRELLSAILNGVLWAVITATIVLFWFQDIKISIIIGLAMIINLITAALAGTLLPLLFKQMNIDPALAGSVALTTITDVVGFVSFLGLATYWYL